VSLAGMLGPATGSSEDAIYDVWLDGLGQFGNQDATDGFSGFNYSMGGGSLGIDRSFGRHFVAGINGGYSFTALDFDAGRGNADIKAASGSLYGTWFTEQAYLDAVVSYARQSYDNERNVVVGPMTSLSRSDHDANMFGATFGGGYRFDLGGFGLRPFLTYSYILLDEQGFTETGAGAANLAVNGRTTNSLVSELGLRAARAFQPEIGAFVPYLSAAWKYDYNIDDRTIISGVAGAPGTAFPLPGARIDQNAALVGAGLLFVRGRWSLSAEYLGEFRGDYTSNGVFARGGFAF
jgi:outer membrane autotransporter protein